MYSSLFCRTLNRHAPTSNTNKKAPFGLKLYAIHLSEYQALVSGSVDVLSESERHRADRFHFAKDRNRFIICRTFLKFLLAQHVGLGMDKIHLEIDANKKPFLTSHPSVFFNLSHSADYALIAIANSPIGVDIEFINKQFTYEEILPTVFNTLEIHKVMHSNDSHRAFYQFWTRKEAIVKAIGKGIDDDLPKIPVTDGTHSVPQGLMGDFKQMTVLSFPINDNYIGALAITEDMSDVDNIIFSPLPNVDEIKNLLN